MRLWHYKLLKYLPKSQLIAQWRELNSIFKKQDKHILINYVYEYPKVNLLFYSYMVIFALHNRGYKIKSYCNFNNYFIDVTFREFDDNIDLLANNPFPNHHNFRYFLQCYYNLQEKYDRGQKDFDEETYIKLASLVEEQIKAIDDWKF